MAIKEKVDLNAQHYRKHSKLQLGLASELLSSYKFKPTAIVLDVGCGDGRITEEIAERLPKGKVVGIDASESMIELAKVSYPKKSHPNLQFFQSKAEDFKTKEKFDTIVSFSCFHWVRKAPQALKQLCSYLKSEGDLLILTYPRESKYYQFMQEALQEYPKFSNLSAYHTMLPILEYKKILAGCGIEFQKFEAKKLHASYKNKKAIKDYIRGWLASYVPLPENFHDDYLDLVVEKSLTYAEDLGDSMIHLPYAALMIRGKKKS